jgi:hypothetical protein
MDMLEARRRAVDGALWQPASLIVAAQAFLLLVISDQTVGWVSASVVTGAALLLSAACVSALLKQVRVEEVLSREVSNHALLLYEQDPNWKKLEEASGLDGGIPAARLLFPLGRGALALADVVTLIAQRV